MINGELIVDNFAGGGGASTGIELSTGYSVDIAINHDPEDIDEDIDYNLNFTFDKAQKRNIKYALSNTFGFGGHNACLVFKKWEE